MLFRTATGENDVEVKETATTEAPILNKIARDAASTEQPERPSADVKPFANYRPPQIEPIVNVWLDKRKKSVLFRFFEKKDSYDNPKINATTVGGIIICSMKTEKEIITRLENQPVFPHKRSEFYTPFEIGEECKKLLPKKFEDNSYTFPIEGTISRLDCWNCVGRPNLDYVLSGRNLNCLPPPPGKEIVPCACSRPLLPGRDPISPDSGRCSNCNGTGSVRVTCGPCGGRGYFEECDVMRVDHLSEERDRYVISDSVSKLRCRNNVIKLCNRSYKKRPPAFEFFNRFGEEERLLEVDDFVGIGINEHELTQTLRRLNLGIDALKKEFRRLPEKWQYFSRRPRLISFRILFESRTFSFFPVSIALLSTKRKTAEFAVVSFGKDFFVKTKEWRNPAN